MTLPINLPFYLLERNVCVVENETPFPEMLKKKKKKNLFLGKVISPSITIKTPIAIAKCFINPYE